GGWRAGAPADAGRSRTTPGHPRISANVNSTSVLPWWGPCRLPGRGRPHACRGLIEDVGAGAEIQPYEAGPGGAETGAGLNRDAAALQKEVPWLVVGAELGAVQPGQVGGLGRMPVERGEAVAEEVAELGAAGVQRGQQVVQPRAAVAEGGDRGDHAEVAGAQRGVGRET